MNVDRKLYSHAAAFAAVFTNSSNIIESADYLKTSSQSSYFS